MAAAASEMGAAAPATTFGRVALEGSVAAESSLDGVLETCDGPSRRRATDVADGRAWWTFASCTSMMLVAGTVYGFGEWSGVLKDPAGYNYDQEAVNTLALMSNFGNYIVLDSGLLMSRYGTPPAMLLGCAYACVGYFGLYLATEHFAGQLPFACLAFLCALYGHGCGTIDTASMTELLADFPQYKGNVVGCVKAYYGMSTATVATIYRAVFAPVRSDFLLFLGVYSGAVGLLLTPVIFRLKGVAINEPPTQVRCKFRLLTSLMVGFALYFFVIQSNSSRIPRPVWLIILCTIAVGALSLFALAGNCGAGRFIVVSSQDEQAFAGEEAAKGSHHPVDVSGPRMLREFDFYLLLAVLILGQGSGLLFINNSGQILPALLGKPAGEEVTSFVAVISIFNSMGRLACGNVSEYLKGTVHRTGFLLLSISIMASGYLVLYLGKLQALWPVAAAIGFGYGGLWGVQPAIVAELFGPQMYGFKYSCSAMAAACGSLLFSTLLAGGLYEREATARGEAPACFASSCYDTAFLTAAVCGVPGLCLGICLYYRTRWIYVALRQPPPPPPNENGRIT